MSTEMDIAMDAGCAREERKRADSLDFNTAGSKSNEETQSKKTTKVNLPTPAGASPNSVSQTTVGISTISPVEHLAALLVNLLQAGAPASGRLQEAPRKTIFRYEEDLDGEMKQLPVCKTEVKDEDGDN